MSEIVIDSCSDDWVPVGNVGVDMLPAWFVAGTVGSTPSLTIEAAFNGTRVVVIAVHVAGNVTPRSLVYLRLAEVVHSACKKLASRAPALDALPNIDQLARVAAIYALEYATWGNPRDAVASAFEMPRSTANRWIKKAAEAYSLTRRGA